MTITLTPQNVVIAIMVLVTCMVIIFGIRSEINLSKVRKKSGRIRSEMKEQKEAARKSAQEELVSTLERPWRHLFDFLQSEGEELAASELAIELTLKEVSIHRLEYQPLTMEQYILLLNANPTYRNTVDAKRYLSSKLKGYVEWP